jgi:hypothetical protein
MTMGSIQLALSDAVKAEALRSVLSRSAKAAVLCVERPDPETACAVVVDPEHLRLLPAPLAHPERIVMVAPGDEEILQAAWDLGVNSVVNEQDPVNTVVLAILAVCLHTGPAKDRTPAQDPLDPPVPRASEA